MRPHIERMRVGQRGGLLTSPSVLLFWTPSEGVSEGGEGRSKLGTGKEERRETVQRVEIFSGLCARCVGTAKPDGALNSMTSPNVASFFAGDMKADVDEASKAWGGAGAGGLDAPTSSSARTEMWGGGDKMNPESATSSGSNRGKLRPPKPFLTIKSNSSSAMKTPGRPSSNFGSGGTLANGGGSGGGGGGIGSFHQAVLSAMKLNRSTSFHHGNAYKVAEQEQQRLHYEQELQQQPKPKAKMKERTKVALKLYIIQQKVAAVQDMVRHLYDLTEICREAEDNLDEDEDEVLGGLAFRRHSGIPPDPLINPKRERLEYCQANFLQKVMELETEVRMLKKLVLFLCKHRIIEKHYG